MSNKDRYSSGINRIQSHNAMLDCDNKRQVMAFSKKGRTQSKRKKKAVVGKGHFGGNSERWHLDELVVLAVSSRCLLRIVPQGESGTMMAFGFSTGAHILHIKSGSRMDETGRDQLSVTHSYCLEVWSLLSQAGSEWHELATTRIRMPR